MKYLYLSVISLLLTTSSCDKDYGLPVATVLLNIDVITTESYSASTLDFHYMRSHQDTSSEEQFSSSTFSLKPDLLDSGDRGHLFDLTRSSEPLTLYISAGPIGALGPRFFNAQIFNKRTQEIETIATCFPRIMSFGREIEIQRGGEYKLSITMDLNKIHLIDGVRAIDFTDQVPTLSRQ